jgi:hypothetical protein
MAELTLAQRCLANTATEWGSSRWAAGFDCERRHHLAYSAGIVPLGESPSYFEIGRLVHACRAYTQLGGDDWNEVLGEAESRGFTTHGKDFDVEPIDETRRLLTAYDWQWGKDNFGWPEGVNVLGVEQFVGAGIVQPPSGYKLKVETRLDSLLGVNDVITIVDIKTRAARWSTEEQQAQERARAYYSCRPQFLQASWLVRECYQLDYYPPIWVDEIVKTKVPTFQRVLVPIKERSVDLWLHAMRQVDLSSVRPNPAACVPAMGSPCAYVKWCHGTEEERALHYGSREK